MTGETPEKDPLPSDLKNKKKPKKGNPPYPPRPREKNNKENSEGVTPPAHRKKKTKNAVLG